MTAHESFADTPPLRMAVIGYGPIGRLHAEAIASSPRAALVAICDCRPERRGAASGQFQVATFEDVGRLLADTRPDAVTIATPDHLHVKPALAALAAGCHVFCEKPLATNPADAERIVAAAESLGARLAVDYNRRFAFGYRTAHGLLNEGRIGSLRYAALRVSDRTPSSEVARTPHVIFTTLLTHHMDLLAWYGGPVVRLQAHAAPVSPGHVLDSVSLALTLRGGAIGTIVAGYRDDQTRTAEWLELGGTRGAIVVEDITRCVVLSGLDPDRRQTFEPSVFDDAAAFHDSITRHLHEFIEAVVERRQPPVTGHDGLVGLKLAAAAVESLETGRAVDL